MLRRRQSAIYRKVGQYSSFRNHTGVLTDYSIGVSREAASSMLSELRDAGILHDGQAEKANPF